ncbi:MAG: hypothetical protein Q4C52_08460 [Eubacteriales bacterium]|nr:hypothetical protein [Eubacteriales bacterium]
MKEKIMTFISTLMLFIPWTILPLRTFPWALESPAAEIMISCYAAFMIFSGIFTILAYTSGRVQHTWMKFCLIVNGVYMIGGIAAFLMMIPGFCS